MLKIQQMVKPFNSGFSAVSVKYMLDDLSNRYWNNIRDGIQFKGIKDKNDYYIYCRIPDESNAKYPSEPLYVDVILLLSPPNASATKLDSIREYDVKVFSNCPAFMFTFTYVYNKKNALIRMPFGYYSRKALTIKPKTRNPLMLYGIEKSIWFAICYLDENKLFNRANLESKITEKYKLRDLIKEFKIKSQEDKLEEIQSRSHKASEFRKKEKERQKFTKQEREEMDRNLQNEIKQQGKTSPKKENIDTLKANMSSDLSSRLNKNKRNNFSSNLKSNLGSKNLKRK